MLYLVSCLYRLHAWGETLEEAFEQCVQAMFGYMTEIDKVEIKMSLEVEAQGEDLLQLLFHLLDEFLFLFSAEPFFIARVSSSVLAHQVFFSPGSFSHFRKSKLLTLTAAVSKSELLVMGKALI